MYKECINAHTLLAEKAVINFDTHINTIRAYSHYTQSAFNQILM